MKKILAIITVSILLMAKSVVAQQALPDSIIRDSIPAFDNFVQAKDLSKARPFPTAIVNSANIRVYAVIWRDIDLTDTLNTILVIPGNSLMQTVMNGIRSGKLTSYEKDDFKKKLTAKESELRFADSVVVPVFDKDGNQISSRMELNEFNPDKVTRFRIKEEVYFDKQRGRVDTKLIAIAPMLHINTSSEIAENIAFTPAYWVYFPQLRYELVKQDLSDPEKNLFDITMDDIFMQQKFSAYLVKESSPGGTQTGQLERGSPEALIIEKKIAYLKKHVWQNPKGVSGKNLETQVGKKKEDKQ